jgi:alpha-D-xyloside xylohydrolase
MQFFNRNGVLEAAREGERLRIESWGKNSLRIRATKLAAIQDTDWALTEPADRTPAEVAIREYEEPSPWGGMRGRTEARITTGISPPR